MFVFRLFYIQVIDDHYKLNSDNISIRDQVVLPARGLIYDRNGELLVINAPTYDLMVIARDVTEIDTLEFCALLSITKEEFIERMNKIGSDPYTQLNPIVFEKQINEERIALFWEKQFRFPGFYILERTLRKYPSSIAAHTLGYIGEVNDKHIVADDYYKSGDYIGISGIEKSYEKSLRGKKGIRKILKDKFNREQGSFMNGKYDIQAVAGTDLYCSLDAKLQEYGELLMQNKKGSVVAIEPATGEILALVTSPTYDPNMLSGRNRAKNYVLLLEDEEKPLMNRALQAQYPPGSTFKVANALTGLQMGALTAKSRYSCAGGFHFGGLTVGCHGHASPLGISGSIQHSCNAWYCWAFRDMIDKNGYKNTTEGFNVWRNHIMSFGFGTTFGSDLPFEYTGNIPKPEYYDHYHGENRWKSLTVISLSIGQGEVLTTPVQLANLAAIVANRGYYYTPHIIQVKDPSDSLTKNFTERHYTTIDRAYFDPVVKGMRDVILAGTATNARIDSVTICGKTGTAQNPHGENHSIFIAFAPMDNPQIAIAVIVENAGYGSTWAAPIASLMAEKYIKGKVTRAWLEDRIKNGIIH